MPVCTNCGEPKTPEELVPSKAMGKRKVSPDRKCLVCMKAYSAEWSRNSRPLTLERRRKANREFARRKGRYVRYGITREEFVKQLEKQGYRCAVCIDPIGDSAHIDHDHENLNLRGLLCSRCNHALGLLRESPDNCLLAAQYLKDGGVWLS